MSQHICTRWAFDLSNWSPTLPQLAQAVAAVQPEECIRLLKFHFLDDFLSSLVGRLLMRKFVSTYSGMDFEEVQFGRDVRGKPYWMQSDAGQRPQLSFNVSHHGNYVVLAGITGNEESIAQTNSFGVGVDIMKMEYSGGKSLAEFFRIMQRKFSDTEWRYIRRAQHNEEAQLKAFMRHWCLKEAYVKELGVGITIDLQKISFTVDATEELQLAAQPLTSTTLRCNDVPMHRWHFEEHLLEPKYCAAIAFKNCKPVTEKFIHLQINDLLVETEKANNEEILEYCRKVLVKTRRL